METEVWENLMEIMGMIIINFIPVDWYYLLLPVFLWVLALVLVPRDNFKSLVWYGLIWGFLAGYVFAWIFGLGLKLFDYQLAEPFKPFGVCIWLSFAWIPAIMIYLEYLPPKSLWYAYPIYLTVFALASASLDEVYHVAGLLVYKGWNPLFRFLIAILWFWGVKVHYIATREAFRNTEK